MLKNWIDSSSNEPDEIRYIFVIHHCVSNAIPNMLCSSWMCQNLQGIFHQIISPEEATEGKNVYNDLC
jgi:hypothetical protein